MNARGWVAVGVAVVIAGGVLAASGVMPLPGLRPPPIEVVESGSDAARAAGEVTAPTPVDPFAPAIPIVESGSDAARDLVGEMYVPLPPMHDPFELPSIPVVESGTDEAWIAHGEEIINVAEQERLAERRRRIEHP